MKTTWKGGPLELLPPTTTSGKEFQSHLLN